MPRTRGEGSAVFRIAFYAAAIPFIFVLPALARAGSGGEALPDFDGMWDYDDPAGTEAAFRKLVPAAEASGDRSYHLQLLTQIARTLGLQRRFDEGHALLDSVESALRPGMETALVRFQLERGRLFNSSGRPEQARDFFLQAYRRSRKARLDFYAIDAAHMMGIVDKGDESLQWNETALEMAERSDDPRARKWAGSLYNNIGWTYHDMGRYDDALRMFEKALEFRRAAGKESEMGIARWCIARCLRSLGRVEEALAEQRALLARSEEEERPDGYVYEELGECLLELGRPGEAAPWFRRAHEELSKDPWLAANAPERLKRLAELGGG